MKDKAAWDAILYLQKLEPFLDVWSSTGPNGSAMIMIRNTDSARILESFKAFNLEFSVTIEDVDK